MLHLITGAKFDQENYFEDKFQINITSDRLRKSLVVCLIVRSNLYSMPTVVI